MLKHIIRLIVLLGVFSLAGWLCRKQTDGFTILKISSDLPYNPAWATAMPNKDELHEMFQQPFTYLARGEQCYVFMSQDKQYVLKFFRQNHMRAPWWAKWLPKEMRRRETLKKESMLEADFTSYRLAFDELKEETGLIFLHLNKTDEVNTAATIIDKLGIAHRIQLDQMEFLVQKCAQPLYPALDEMIRLGKIDEAQSTLTQLVHLLMKTRYEMGIADTDPDLNINYGCIGAQPVQIDIGRLKRGEVKKTAAPNTSKKSLKLPIICINGSMSALQY